MMVRELALDTTGFRLMVEAAADAVNAEHRSLSRLDAATGDGDHGINLKRAMDAARSAVAGRREASPGTVLALVGEACAEEMGGAAGALFGSFLAAAADVLGDRPDVDAATLAEALSAGAGRVAAVGGAAVGDRSMVDALAPAAEAARAAARSGSGPADVLSAAAAAARRGADKTRDLAPRVGRARYAGDHAVGSADPGATSVALILGAWADAIKEARMGVHEADDVAAGQR